MIYFSYLVLALAIVVIELWRKKRLVFDYLTYFNAIFVLAYVVTPVLLHHYSENAVYIRWLDEIFLLTLISYLSALSGWVLGGTSTRRYIEVDEGKVIKTINRYTILVVLVAVFYITSKGGVISLLVSGALVRYGYEDPTATSFDFLQNVYSAAEIVTYVLFAMRLSNRYRPYRRLIGWNYLLVLSFYVLYMLSTSSRGAIANALIVHFMILIYFRGGFVRFAVPLLFILVVLTLYGKQLFFAIASFVRGDSFIEAFTILDEARNAGAYVNPVIEKVLKEFTHSIDSLIPVVSGTYMIEYTYFSDFFLSLLRVIPQRIVMQFVELPATISTINTSVLTGEKIASIPPGLMGHFYHSLSLVGIVVGFFAYGLIGRKISDRIADAVRGNDVAYAVYVYTALMFGFFVANGDPNVYFYSVLWPLVVYNSLSMRLKRARGNRLTAPVTYDTNSWHKLPLVK
jgi:hypothetical protein